MKIPSLIPTFRCLFIMTLMLTSWNIINSQVIYVDLNASGANNGSSWTDAYTDLQDALTAASPGNDIWVAQGTYYPTANSSDRDATFELKNDVHLYGGFNGTETNLNQRDWASNTTILSGDINQNGLHLGNSYSVVTADGVDNTAILDGFEIIFGNADEPLPALFPHRNGAGLFILSGSPQILNCVFQDNQAVGNGGAVFISSASSPVFDNCQFLENTAESGGAVFNGDNSLTEFNNSLFTENTALANGGVMYNVGSSNITIIACEFSENSANFGGAILNQGSSPTITSSTFQSNSANSWGGAIYNFQSSNPQIINSTFVINESGDRGGAIVNHINSNPLIMGCLFQGNSTNDEGSAIYNTDNSNPGIANSTFSGNISNLDNGCLHSHNISDPVVLNSIFWDNGQEIVDNASTTTVVYSIVQGGFPGNGNLDIDPDFMPDFSLSYCSPAKNAGNPDTTGLGLPQLDLAGNPRIFGDTVDMGAFEFQAPCVIPCPSDSILYVTEGGSGAMDGSSWSNSMAFVQDALAVACGCPDVTEIWVAEGTYYPDEGVGRTDDDRNETFTLCNNVKLYGGFDGTETQPSQRDWSNNITILSGDINQSDSLDENSYTVVTGSGTDETAVIDGFIITMGYADDIAGPFSSPNRSGGGIYNHSGSPGILNCIITGNKANVYGGGMYNFNSSPTITNSTFSGNTADWGGGMYNSENSSPTISNTTFSGNTANWGGGMYNRDESSPTITNSTFSGNAAIGDGGGMSNRGSSSPDITNCTFSGNTADGNGGGIYFRGDGFTGDFRMVNCLFYDNSTVGRGGSIAYDDQESGTFEIINSTFFNNSASEGGVLGITFWDSGFVPPTFINSIAWGNSSTFGQSPSNTGEVVFSYSLIQEIACPTGAICNSVIFDQYPLFEDTSANNLQLTICSPAINAGNPDTTGLNLPALDLAGNPRIFGDTVDLGAYEWQSFPCFICPADSILYVVEGGSGSEDGTSWANAMPFLQDALALGCFCTNVTQIWVAEGTYYPDEGDFVNNDDRNASFTLCNNLALYGGFNGTETSVDQRDLSTFETFLSGDINQSSTLDGNSYSVVTGSGTDTTAVIDGFRIILGNADNPMSGSHQRNGAGMFNLSGSPKVANCTFLGNFATNSGAGMYNNDSSSPTIENCQFELNTAGQAGGAIYNDNQSSPTIMNSEFLENTASNGGALFNRQQSHPLMVDCGFYYNNAGEGGAMYNFLGSAPQIINSQFEGNSALNRGGAIINSGSSPMISGCWFNWNQAPNGGGIHNEFNSAPLIFNSNFENNSAGQGGAISNALQSSPSIVDCRFDSNSAVDYGGAIYFSGSGFTGAFKIINSLFTSNTSNIRGGAIAYIDQSAGSFEIINSTFYDNQSTSGGVLGIVAWNSGNITPEFINCISWGNSSTFGQTPANTGEVVFTYSLIQEAVCPAGANCNSVIFDEDPGFEDPDMDNFQLSLCSPAINAGNPDTSGLGLPMNDLAGNPRIVNDTIDLGAYEWQSFPCFICPADSILYVVEGGSGSEDGTSWANAMPFLQDALALGCFCTNVTQIWVAEGTYYPDEGDFVNNDDRDASFTLCNNLTVYGGFSGTETQVSQRDWVNNVTILSGDINQSNTLDGNSYTVVTGSGTDETAVIDGFTITMGNADATTGPFSSPNRSGGGIYNHSGSPGILNCTITGNEADSDGGGMYNFNSSPTITNCTFAGNTAHDLGGGMFNSNNSSPIITNCSFSGNTAQWGGGMLNENNSSPTITNCTFSANTAHALGGGMYNENNSSPTITNSTFSGNMAIQGGGMFNFGSSSPAITNCSFSGNTAANSGGGIYFLGDGFTGDFKMVNCLFYDNSAVGRGGAIAYDDQESGTFEIINSTFFNNSASEGGVLGITFWNSGFVLPTFINSIAWGNSSTFGQTPANTGEVVFSYSLIQEIACPTGATCNSVIFDQDPLFEDTSANNLQLTICSPAINAGNPDTTGLNLPALDLAGNPRIIGGVIDMGAYEFTGDLVFVSCNQNIQYFLDNNGEAEVLPQDLLDSLSGCGLLNLSIQGESSWTVDCSDIPGTTLWLILTDPNGNQDSCESIISIIDNIPPFVVCTDITVQLDSMGEAGIVPLDIGLGTTDNCSILFMDIDQDEFDCSDVGTPVTVMLFAADESGNTNNCSATITLEDNVAPTALCQDVTVDLDASGNGSTTAAEVDNGSNDACGIQSLSLSQTDFDCDDVGSVSVTLTVEDNNGNTATCSANVTVEDNVAPTAICQDVTVNLDATGNGSTTAAEVDDGSNDACGIQSLSLPQTEFDCGDVGSVSVTLTVEDNNGNTATCTANVTVEDNVAPTALCQDVTVDLDASGNGSTTAAEVDNGSDDACGIQSLSLSQTDFDCDDIGTVQVTLTVEDNNGNTATCTSNVSVEDNTPPDLSCAIVVSQMVANVGDTSVFVNVPLATATDNCSAVITIENDYNSNGADASDIYPVGSTLVTFTAEDEEGNISTCVTEVIVVEDNSVVAICQNITLSLDANGELTMSADEVDGGSFGGTGTLSFEIGGESSLDFDCSDVGTNPVILSVTDEIGESDDCNAVVTIEDNTPPTAFCQNVTVNLDATGNGSTTAAEVDNGSNDACGIQSLSLSQTDFDCGDVGTVSVTLTVEDNNGNIASCTANVTVEDNVAPTAICQDVTVDLDASGNGSTTAAEVDNGSNDACGIQSLSLSQTGFDCDDIGTVQVTLTVEDNNGNTATCTSNVSVEDNTPPDLSCAIVVSQMVANVGDTSVFVNVPLATATDNCSAVITIENDYNSNGADASDIYPVGSTLVTFTAEDEEGNISTCVTEVIVVEDNSVVAICQNITLSLDANGELTMSADEVDGGSFGGTGTLSFEIGGESSLDFDCSDVGTNPVILTVTDEVGESDDCHAVVTIEDNTPPTALCQNVTVNLDATGNGSTTAAEVDNGSDDACGIQSLSLSQTDFDCGDVGTVSVTLTVEDNNGNIASCAANVTVEDNVAPTAICQDVTVDLDASGNGSPTAAEVDNGSDDACGIQSLSLSQTDFDCDDIGTVQVTLTVEDNNGNTATCSANVNVADNIPPDLSCAIVVSQMVANVGDPSVFVSVPLATATDNCSAVIVIENDYNVNGADASDIYPVGSTFVTFTAEDEEGNTATCVTEVVVLEDNSVIAVCQDITLSLDAMGALTMPADELDGGSFGGTGSLSFEIGGESSLDFDCSDVGTNPLTLTVTDEVGESDDCSAIVTIEDDTPPTALCQDMTVSLDATGNGSTTAAEVDDGSNDACGIQSLSLSQTDFDCGDVGTVVVTLTIEDNNGNTATCTANVSVLDQIDPGISCPADASILVPAGETEGFVNLDLATADDNCPGVAITNNYNAGGADASDVYPLGVTTVTFTATDQSGNTAECQTQVTVTEDVIPGGTFELSGNISTTFGVNINNVEMVMTGDEMQIEFSNPMGLYDFLVEGGNSVTITPEKDENWLDGVSTFDVVLIQRHIVFLDRFTNPYQIIAGDANGDGFISTFDLVLLQSLIVGSIDNIPGNTSWRFIPASYDFIDPENPLLESWPEEVNYVNVNSDLFDEDWVAMKTGDVSGDAGLSGIRRVAGNYSISAELMEKEDSENWVVQFSPSELIDLSGYQLEIQWDPNKVSFIDFDISNTALTNLGKHHFFIDSEAGIVRTNWWHGAGQILDPKEELFRLEFEPLVEGLNPEIELKLAQRGSRWYSEAYRTADDGLLNLSLNWKQTTAGEAYALYPNTPNPYRDYTQIHFELPRAEEVKLTIWDQGGALLKQVDIDGQKGMNEFLLKANTLPAGVLYYRIEAGEWEASNKMIRM